MLIRCQPPERGCDEIDIGGNAVGKDILRLLQEGVPFASQRRLLLRLLQFTAAGIPGRVHRGRTQRRRLDGLPR